MKSCYLIKALTAATLLTSAAFAAPVVNDSGLTVTQVITSGTLSSPTSMVFLSETEIFVAEKVSGQVKRIIDGVVDDAPVLDLPVNFGYERGLLGMVLDPQFPENPHLYLFYTRAESDGTTAIDQRISRFTWTNGALADETVILTLPVTPGPVHSGGILRFGPPTVLPADQKLFAVLGDLNRENQTENFFLGGAPDDTAVVIRINRDGSTPSGVDKGVFYDVPGANASLQRQFAYGIRNSFGLTFDPLTGHLWDTENGADDYDEINRVEPGFNSGWKRVMGPSTAAEAIESGNGLADLVTFGNIGTYSEPEFAWRQTIAPTAIHFLTNTALGPGYQYDCFVGCSNNGKIYRFEPNAARDGFVLNGSLSDTVLDVANGEGDSEIVFATDIFVATDMETGPDGALYILTFLEGQIHRIATLESGTDNWPLYE